MTQTASGPKWPLWLWGLQLIPATFLLVYALWRLTAGSEGESSVLRSILGLGAGALWSATALLMLAFRNGRHWLVARRKELVLSAVAAIASLAAADVALNAMGVVPTLAEQRARSIAYTFGRFSSFRMVPKDILVDDGTPIHINKRGFRGPEISPVKPPGTRRIVFLGGSHVFDYFGGGWPRMAGDELRGRGREIEVINAGVPGHSSTDSLAKLLTDIWVLAPDIVFFCQTWNDIKYFTRLSPATPYRGLPPEEPVSWLKDWRTYPIGLDRLLTASAIYREIRSGLMEFLITEEGFNALRAGTGPRSPASTEPFERWGPVQYELNLKLLATLSQRIGAELILCKQAHLLEGTGTSGMDARAYALRNARLSLQELRRAYDACNRAIDNIAAEHDLFVVDMDQALSGHREYFWDSIHFNPTGSRAAARLVADALSSRVPKPR